MEGGAAGGAAPAMSWRMNAGLIRIYLPGTFPAWWCSGWYELHNRRRRGFYLQLGRRLWAVEWRNR
jgi:hypothetical protein